MLSKRYRSFLQPPKFIDVSKQSTSGILLSDTITTTTTSSGYSIGGSSMSTTIASPSKKSSSSIPHNQHKTKSKDKQRKPNTHGFYNFITKLKSFIISPKTKLLNSSPSKKPSSSNMVLQYSTSYHLPSSSTNNTISLPFTYYHKSSKQSKTTGSYITKATNFEKISAWLDHTIITTEDDNDLQFIDECQQESIPSSPVEIDPQIIMKKISTTNKTPKRSTSMVSTMTRPIIEQKQYEKTVSPTYSFSSSILARGMTERMTPQTIYHQSRINLPEEQTNILLPKSNRRRTIDFARRRTVGGPNEQMNNNYNNKENVSNNHHQQIYRFSPTTSTNIVTKKYYFHSNPPVKNEDILMNSYGLTILQQQQQQQQQPIQQRQSVSIVTKKPQIPDSSSIRIAQKQVHRRPSIHLKQQECTSDLLDDILCDREVESYFYPNRRQSPPPPHHIYMNLGTSSNYYHPPPYIHSTLC